LTNFAVGFESKKSRKPVNTFGRRRRIVCRRPKRRQPARLFACRQEYLGDASIGFISFLESAGVLPPPMREMVIDRANAISGGPLDLEDLKIIVLMVFLSLGEEPDALILDELFVDEADRLIH
jgi:uncharacterized protein Smg (DUF494 family)